MKKFFVLLCFLLLFLSCTNDGFESDIAASAQKRDYCRIVIGADTTCYTKLSTELCKELGGESKLCRPPSEEIVISSSSEVEYLSSSSEEDISSSSLFIWISSSSIPVVEISSSSIPIIEISSSSIPIVEISSSSLFVGVSSSDGSVAPIVTGNFEFRNFDYSSSSSKIYFLNRSMHVSSTPTGTSQLYNSLSITNAAAAQCGAITVEIIGGGLTLTGIGSEPNQTYTTEPGLIIATAVAICNGIRTELIPQPATAEVVANYIISEECVLPSTYLHKAEVLTNLVTITDNYGRCTEKYDVSAYSPQMPSVTKPTVGATLPLTNYSGKTITVRAQIECSGALTVTKSCGEATVAENYVKFDHNDEPKYPISKNSSTVIEISTTDLPTGLGCEYSGSSATPISFSYNGKPCSENKSYWTECNFSSSDIDPTNGNRILFKTTLNQDLLCTTFVKP